MIQKSTRGAAPSLVSTIQKILRTAVKAMMKMRALMERSTTFMGMREMRIRAKAETRSRRKEKVFLQRKEATM